jgi:hypothetical protein
MSSDDQQTAAPPFAVPIPEARRRLGNKSRGSLYEALGRGQLVGIKDGSKTLILTASIDRYLASLPRAVFKSPNPPRSHRRQKR